MMGLDKRFSKCLKCGVMTEKRIAISIDSGGLLGGMKKEVFEVCPLCAEKLKAWISKDA